jgi:hypothetical protein
MNNKRITVAIAFSLREIYHALGEKDQGLYSTTDELVAALTDQQVYDLYVKLTKPYQK